MSTWKEAKLILPERNTKCLVTDEFGNVVINYLMSNGEWMHDYARMVAWMELPEAWKESEDGIQAKAIHATHRLDSHEG